MKVFKPLTIFVLTFFLALPAAIAEEEAGPALWSIADEDTTIHFFGTIHMMNAGVKWYTPKVKAAFEAADTLFLELGPEQFDMKVVQPLLAKHGLFMDAQKLPDVLSPETYEEIRAVLEKMGAPGNSMDTLKPWMVATFLVVQSAQAEGFLPALGVDTTLMQRALSAGKPVQGLETMDQQFSVFSEMSMETQVFFLEATLEELDELIPLFEMIRDAWMAGDVDGLDAQLNEDWEDSPELKEALLDGRNRNWVEVLSALMDQPGKFFVAVGTGHLVGENNVLELLEARGFEVTLH